MRPLAVDVPHTFTLIPASCLHFPLGDTKLTDAWIARVNGDPNARTLLMGDALDQARTHYREHVRAYRADRNSQIQSDRHVRMDVEALAKKLSPIRAKIWGIMEGNHFWEFNDGTTSDQYLAQLLEIPFLGAMAFIRVRMKRTATDVRVITVWAHHSGGSHGGGRTLGGSANSVSRHEAAWDADIFLLGHDHRRFSWAEPVMSMTQKGEPRLLERTRIFGRVGAFLKGMEHEKSIALDKPYVASYAEKAAYRPTDLGWIEIKCRMIDRGWPKYDLAVPGV